MRGGGRRRGRGSEGMINEKFRSAIREKYKNESEFARKIGWTKQKLSKTILGKRSPKISEINTLSKAMGISVEELISFFDAVVSERDALW